jgi:hypothetical protein
LKSITKEISKTNKNNFFLFCFLNNFVTSFLRKVPKFFNIRSSIYQFKKVQNESAFSSTKKVLDSDKLVDLPNLLTSGCSGGGVNATCG